MAFIMHGVPLAKYRFPLIWILDKHSFDMDSNIGPRSNHNRSRNSIGVLKDLPHCKSRTKIVIILIGILASVGIIVGVLLNEVIGNYRALNTVNVLCTLRSIC